MGEQKHNEVQGIDALEDSWLGLNLEDSPGDFKFDSTESDEAKGLAKRMANLRNADYDPLERVSVTRITHNEIKAMRAATNAAQPPLAEPKASNKEKSADAHPFAGLWDRFLAGFSAAAKRR